MKQFNIQKAQQRIRKSRDRSHLLKNMEFKTIDILCKIMPDWVSPDMLTFTGLLGSVIVAGGLMLAMLNPLFLFLSVLGLAVQWFGDSLDGRIAYYRNTPRKWYGWSLDINADWISICLICMGFYIYLPSFKFLAILMAMAYGGAMIISLLNYKVTDKYVIDKGLVGPTEFRIVLSLAFIIEFFLPGTLAVFALLVSGIIIISNVIDSFKVLKSGDHRDEHEKVLKSKQEKKAA